QGSEVTLISYGAMMQPTLAAADQLRAEDGVEAEVIDLLTVSPLDHETISDSVRQTGRAVIVNEAPRSFGVAAEVVARLVEKSFWYLEAPLQRVTGADVIVPMFAYEQTYLPDAGRVVQAARATLNA
ncbi:MAG: alpha-ketoacid dehydrogenase subunit beta, partial [Anaerolineales bacterium]|nr:alpha-ketoacid dehydrogenase subunit beta [Anaerolineales bacterium]